VVIRCDNKAALSVYKDRKEGQCVTLTKITTSTGGKQRATPKYAQVVLRLDAAAGSAPASAATHEHMLRLQPRACQSSGLDHRGNKTRCCNACMSEATMSVCIDWWLGREA
jgi:hypothetical protein